MLRFTYLAITQRLKILAQKPLVFLGTISYPLYLIHLQIQWLTTPLVYYWLPEIALIFRVMLAIGVASYLTSVIELPAAKWIKAKYKKNTSIERTR